MNRWVISTKSLEGSKFGIKHDFRNVHTNMKRRNNQIVHILLILGMLIISFASGSTLPVEAVAPGTLPATQGGASGFGGFHLLSEDQGWMVFKNQLYWTSDGGSSWNLISASISGLSNIAAVDFVDHNEGRVLMVSSGVEAH